MNFRVIQRVVVMATCLQTGIAAAEPVVVAIPNISAIPQIPLPALPLPSIVVPNPGAPNGADYLIAINPSAMPKRIGPGTVLFTANPTLPALPPLPGLPALP